MRTLIARFIRKSAQKIAKTKKSQALSPSNGPIHLSDEEILRRLVGLNAGRAEEEKRGLIRWLRPDTSRTPPPRRNPRPQGRREISEGEEGREAAMAQVTGRAGERFVA
jgi:hypothetical protein